MKLSKSKFDELIKLQILYRQRKIDEEKIPKDKLKELKELYYEQINFLKRSIAEDKKKILKIKKNLG